MGYNTDDGDLKEKILASIQSLYKGGEKVDGKVDGEGDGKVDGKGDGKGDGKVDGKGDEKITPVIYQR